MAVGSKLVGIATGVVVRKLADKAISSAWRKTKHTEPPSDPASPATPWGEAISWAAASGVALGVAKLVATKGTATAKAKIMGTPHEAPPAA